MTNETQITQNNIGNYLSSKKDNLVYAYCKEHKASCQRFLEFLESDEMLDAKHSGNYNSELEVMEEKIQDLKQTIKLYDEAGI